MGALFDQLTALATLVQAFDRVEENHGGPGIDGETVEEFGAGLEENLSRLQRELVEGRYQPLPLLRVYVEKLDGSLRPLSIPTVRDRTAQTAAALVLTPILEAEFEDVSFAYRQGRSVDQAVRRIVALRNQGYRWVVDADIRSYFDEIPHQALLTVLGRYVDDAALLALVQQWLTAEVQDQGVRFRLEKGVPQGSPLSPLLANLYLDRFDEAHLRQGHKLVRFADDFVILCKTRPKAEAALELAQEVLDDLHLSLHPNKTRITHFDHGFRYLGVQFLRSLAFRPQYPEELPETAAPMALLRQPQPPPTDAEAPAVAVARPRLRLPAGHTAVGQALDRALSALPAEQAHTFWEEFCEGMEEADLPPPAGVDDAVVRSLYLMEQGAELGKEDERFVVRKSGAVLRKIPALKVDQILVFGNVHLTTPAMQFCLLQDIPIFLLSSRGRYYGVVESPATDKVLLHRDQFARAADAGFTLEVAREIVRGKVSNARTLVLRAARREQQAALEHAATALQDTLNRLQVPTSLDELRGMEGAAAAHYFAAWPTLVGEAWSFPGRKRRPPPDPVNSLLSFGYTLLFYNAYSLVRAQGLHPHVGLYHALRPGHPALVSDLIEEFRAPVVDATVLALLHRRQVRPEDFRLPTEAGMPCLLTDAARKKVTHAFEAAFNRAVRHPDATTRCDYRRAIALQAQRLVAVITGQQPRYAAFLTR